MKQDVTEATLGIMTKICEVLGVTQLEAEKAAKLYEVLVEYYTDIEVDIRETE